LGRNELFLLSNYCPLMKLWLLPLSFFILVSFFSASSLYAQQQGSHRPVNPVFQEIDQAYRKGKLNLEQRIQYKIFAIKDPQKLPAEFQFHNALPLKCGTPAFIDFYKHRRELSPATVSNIESEINPPRIQSAQTFTSPSGRFLIHYETSGNDAVPSKDSNNNGTPDYVEEVAAAADSAFRYEVKDLGYPDPIPSGKRYNVEITNLQKIYGQTYTINGTTHIQIENDFSEGFPPNTDPEGNQIGDIKVTMAHEFKHAINYGINHWSGETTDWGEMDATLEEELVYDNVNDYYNYLKTSESIFNSPETSFYPGSYYHVTWAIFFEEKYGSQFWPQVWQIIGNNSNIRMVNAMTQELGSRDAFDKAYILSELWHYASGSQNSIQGFGFDEKQNYPNPKINDNFLGIDSLNSPRSIPKFAANYIELDPGIQQEGVLDASFSFTAITSGLGLIAEFNDGSYDVKTSLGSEKMKIAKTNWEWKNIKRVGIVAVNSSDQSSLQYTLKVFPSLPDQITLNQNYPNPFNPDTIIQFSLTNETHVRLRVYDVAGRLVQTLRNKTLTPGYYQVPFDGSNLASGVYIYQLVTNHHALSKKMTLIK